MNAARLAWIACLSSIACRDTPSTSIVVMPRASALSAETTRLVQGLNYSPRDIALGWQSPDSIFVGHVESFAYADIATSACEGTGIFMVPFTGGGLPRPVRVGAPVCDGLLDASEVGVALSPDANAIVYSMPIPTNRSQLMRLSLSDLTRLVISDGCSPYAQDPAISNDGSMIAMTGLCEGRSQPQPAVYVASIDGTNRRRVFGGDSVAAVTPAWSPDGKSLVVRLGDVTTSTQVRRLAVVELASRESRVLVPGSSPSWSPDGRWIAFIHRDSGSVDDTEIRLIRPEGSEIRTLFRNRLQTTFVRGFGPMREGMVRRPILWTPDSRGVVFGRAFDKGISLWLISFDTAEPRQLTESTQR